jgi:hypothetical protein
MQTLNKIPKNIKNMNPNKIIKIRIRKINKKIIKIIIR